MMVFTGVSFAWFFNTTADIVPNPTGEVITSYFHCGSGTEEDPYIITRPVHLYNLTRLYEDLDGFAEANNHFQLGYDLDEDGDLECYSYNDNGVYTEGYSDSLNMNYYENFVPIGSEEKPFGGIFDGSNLTIDKLNISGDGLSDIGVFGYVTENAEIKDLYIDNLDIDVSGAVVDAHDEHDENAFVGYIVGHLENANCITNTYVNNCEITGNSCYTRNDWGYYGYCDNASSLDAFIAHAGNEDPSWGGSVNMHKMYDRLYTIAGRATTNNNYAFEKDIVTRANGTTFERDALNGYAYTYRNQLEGSFVFTRYNAQNGPQSNFMYLNGGTRYHQIKQTETQVSGGQKISYNGHYLGVNGTNVADHEDAWQWSNNYLSIYIDGTQYYLTHNLTLSATTQETWTKNGNRFYYTTSSWFTPTYNYLTYSNNRWNIASTTTRNNATQLTWTNATYTRITESSNGADYMDYSGTNVTYFPLITEDNNYNVTGKNTGYVIAGSEDNTTSAYPDKTGDIRVSKYATSDINRSYSNGNLNTVYTINSSLQTTQINVRDYEKYTESKEGFLESIDGSNIYGLHFMPANISINHLVTADYTLINGEEKSNYQMPASSIDFNLMEKGYINFFAGTYFSGNNSFFSLHHIERNDNDEITSIKEIAEIYKSSNDRKDYIYKYTNNTYSDTLTYDYSLVFSTNRIKRQNSITTNAVYYFE
ncbi:MAG: hypothetical protein J6Z11_08895, partial [Candidatus Riflebacteria bacterium]|nr:hypothetical protein [Candidatus Riflebacteria bacterium]